MNTSKDFRGEVHLFKTIRTEKCIRCKNNAQQVLIKTPDGNKHGVCKTCLGEMLADWLRIADFFKGLHHATTDHQ